MLALLVEAALRSLALGGAVWLALTLLRVRDPRVQMMAWTVVLVASLSMPLIMHRLTLTLPSAAPTLPLEIVGLPLALQPEPTLQPMPTAEEGLRTPAAPRLGPAVIEPHRDAVPTAAPWRIDWQALATALATGAYLLVAIVMLLRLLLGIVLTWRLTRAARPIDDDTGANIRVSDVVGVPVTFASTILLPPECTDWSPTKRQAVLSHERSHVVRGDCYLLLLAALNRAVFWFSPFAWWQLARLSELAEMISDDAAIEALADRRSYADLLLDLAGDVRHAPAGLAVARAGTLGRRVDRILAATAVPSRAGSRRQLMIAAVLAPLVAICAASVVRATRAPVVSPTGVAGNPAKAESSPAVAASSIGGQLPAMASVDPQLLASYVGYYRLSSGVILAVTQDGSQLSAQLPGEERLRIFPASEREFVYKAAARITFIAHGEGSPAELMLRQDGNDLRAVRVGEVPNAAHPAARIDPAILDSYVGWYELNALRALAITREGERLFVQVTGRAKFEIFARDDRRFVSANGSTFIIFPDPLAGGNAASKLLLHDPIFGARDAPRIDQARAAQIEDVFARLVATAPDRFKDQAPTPGGNAALLQAIADLQRDPPSYERLSQQLAESVRRNASELRNVVSALGAADSVFFRGVGPWGYDIYGGKFARGFAEFRLLMGADGKIEDMVVRPDGDGTPGGFVACVDEPTSLTSAAGAAPIKLLIYNASGADIQLFEINAEGKRMPYGTIADEHTAPIRTNVGHPWVVADASGRCRAIILPGQRARFLRVPPARAGEQQIGLRRSTPTPGAEDALRRYIDALAHGHPDYDQMTPAIAAQTRQQLPINQAILAKLGELRAISFRGATQLDNDIYMAYFANGSAEFRIGLVKEGRIGRFALGPQY
jgi:hypothetical protein